MNAAWRAGMGYWALVALLIPCGAAPLRVANWNLEPPPALASNPPMTVVIAEAAAALRQANPDVILLQRITDPRLCAQLIDALKPASYQVLICSAFRHPQLGFLSRHQAAILARQGACSSGSQTWRAPGQTNFPGGCVFAALQTEAGRVGFFCVQLDDQLAQAVAGPQSSATAQLQAFFAEQWIRSVDLCHHWPSNSIDAVVASGSFEAGLSTNIDSSRRGSGAAFLKGFLSAPLDEAVSVAVSGAASGMPPEPVTARLTVQGEGLNGLIFNTAPTVCDLDLAVAAPPVQDVKGLRPVTATRPNETATPLPPSTSAGPARATATPAPESSSRPERKPAEAAQSPAAEKPAREQPSPSPAHPAARTELQAASGNVRHAPGMPRYLSYLMGAAAIVLTGTLVVRVAARRRRAAKPSPAPDSPAPAAPPVPASAAQTGLTASPTSAAMTPPTSPTSTSTSAAPASPAGGSASAVQVVIPESGRSSAALLKEPVETAEHRADHAEAVIKAGLLPQVGQWLKEKLVRRLLSDRKQLLEAQEAAAFKAKRVDERLAQLEGRIAEHNQAYEQRVEELTRELRATKEENREMIRVMIAQVEAEREAARAKLLAEAAVDSAAPRAE